MPGFLTHYLAGQAVLSRLPDENTISGDRGRVFSLGTQGADIFFYYVPGFMRKRSRNIGSDIHNADFGLFFTDMAKRAKRVEDNGQKTTLLAYLSGFLVHYALDATAHPFVYANSTRAEATGLQASAEHRNLETIIDVLMLARLTGQKPGEIRQWELIDAPPEQKRAAAALFSAAARAVYKRQLQPQDVYHAMGHMKQLTRLLHSPGGRRKKWAAFLEDKTVDARILSAMVHPQTVTDETDYLNLSRAYWKNRNESFPVLFDSAVDEAVIMLNGFHAYIRGEIPRKELAALVGNRSLTTGEPCPV